MENASKALLIAGGVLLLMLALSFGVYLFTKIGGRTANLYSDIEQSDINEFNQKFFEFEDKKELSIQDVVSIINLARNYNDTGKFPVIVTVTFDGEEMQDKTKDEITKLLSSDNFNTKFSCEIDYAEEPHSDLVGSVKVEKK